MSFLFKAVSTTTGEKDAVAKHREGWHLPRFLERGSGMKGLADFKMAAQRHKSTSLVDSLCSTETRCQGDKTKHTASFTS